CRKETLGLSNTNTHTHTHTQTNTHTLAVTTQTYMQTCSHCRAPRARSLTLSIYFCQLSSPSLSPSCFPLQTPSKCQCTAQHSAAQHRAVTTHIPKHDSGVGVG